MNKLEVLKTLSKEQEDSSSKNLRKMRKRQINRETIIKYAEKEFIEKGYANAKVEDIALNSGNAKATVYNYFESKDDLLTGVLSNIYKLFLKLLTDEFNSAGNNKELRTIIQAYVKFDDIYPAHSGLLLSAESLLINKRVYEKIAQGLAITESEEEYRNLEANLVKLVDQIFVNIFKNASIDTEFYIKMRRIFINFVFMIRETIVIGKLLKRQDEEIKDDLDIIIKIIEHGIKNYQ